MLYNLLNLILRIAVRVYFKKITVHTAAPLPEEGPMIIVANHPNTFMDPIVIGLQMKQKLFFLSKAAVFRSAFSKWLLPKFNMIPVYRAQDDPTQMHRNEETFDKCYECLARKGTIMIFPEGVSLTQRKLEKLKTGAARIALGAEAANGYKLGVKVLTVGLNYSNPHRFQSELFMNIDTGINVMDFAEQHKQDAFKAAQALTDLIRKRMEEHIIAIEDADTDRLVKNIETVYKSKLLQERPTKEEDFAMTKRIVEAVNYFKAKQPQRVQRVSQMANNYFTDLDRLDLNDYLMKNFSKSRSVFFRSTYTLAYLILGFPFWLFGAANNYLPYKLPYYITRAVTKKQDWHGALFVGSGVITFIIFYSFQIYLVHRLFHLLFITLGYFIFLPVTGYFAFAYHRRFTNLRGKWLVFNLFMKRSTLISRLITMRQQIISEFDQGRVEFLSTASA